MGVADNKSYKNQYHFKDLWYPAKLDDFPSINIDSDVNTTIKQNNERSNVEIEKGELVLEPDMSALFKALGKKHTNGGTDVYLKPDSFIFSDDKSLAINESEHKLFELKKGGKFTRKTTTPAMVVKKNVDIEHYNRLVSNLDDNMKDDIAKKSSAMMLEKYINTLGNVAYIQEQKKNFPDGIPAFSQDTAPVYETGLKNDIMSQKQYAKYGGRTMGPGGPLLSRRNTGPIGYDPSAPLPGNWQLWHGDKLPLFKDKFNVSNAADKITDLDQLSSQLGYDGPKDNYSFQKWLYQSSPQNRAIIDKWHTQYGEPNIGQPTNKRERFDGKIGIRWQNAIQEILANKPAPRQSTPSPVSPVSPAAPAPVVDDNPNIHPSDIDGNPQGSIQAGWKFSPYQKLSQLYQGSKWAGLNRYMPTRSHMNPSYVDPSLVNPEQAVGDMQSSANAQLRSLNTLNPALRNAQASSIYGDLLDKTPQVRSQYDNQNAQITNQSRQYNNQIRNNANAQNISNDQNYYQQSVTARSNFDNMKSYLGDQWMNNVMGDVQDNQSLAYNLMTQNNPVYSYDWNTGNFNRNKKNILDVQTDNKSDFYTQLASTFMQKLQRGEKLDPAEVNFFKSLSLGKIPFSPDSKKKGGYIKK